MPAAKTKTHAVDHHDVRHDPRATSRRPHQLVAVIGPPAVGKSSATALAAAALGAHVFRLREFAERFRVSHPELDHLFETADPLGWFRDEAVKMLLEMLVAAPPRSDVVLLENLPGNDVQLRVLLDLACASAFGLQLVELAAPDGVVALRARARRVCPGCEPDRRGDPHRPARGRPRAPGECVRCGGRLVPRWSDEPHSFQARLRRFREYRPEIVAAAEALRVPHHVFDATGGLASVARDFLAACQRDSATTA